jgi:hypothetical protein
MLYLLFPQFLLGYHRHMDQVIHGSDMGSLEPGFPELLPVKFRLGQTAADLPAQPLILELPYFFPAHPFNIRVVIFPSAHLSSPSGAYKRLFS